MLGAAEGLAAEWHVTPSFEIDESYNDNINLVTSNQQLTSPSCAD
jgi:hypothetical protein